MSTPSFTSWLAQRIASFACAAGGSILAAGAIAGLAGGSFCVNLATTRNPGPTASADLICRSVLSFGTTCLITGLAIVVFLVLSRGWSRRARKPGAEIDEPAWWPLLSIPLSALAVWTFVAATPAFEFISQNFDRLSQSLDAAVLAAPLFEFTTTATLFAGGLAVLLLFFARSQLFARAYVTLTLAEVGFLVCNRAALEITRVITASAGLRDFIFQQHDAAMSAGVQHLGWLLVAHVIGIPVFLVATLSNAALGKRERGRTPHEPAVAPPTISDEPGFRVAPATAGPGKAGPFEGVKYFVHAVYISWPLAGKLKIDDLDGARTFTARIVPGQLRPIIEIKSQTGGALLTIVSRGILAIGAGFDIRDVATGETLGMTKKAFASAWAIHDSQDRRIGTMTQESESLGAGAYVAHIGEQPVASFRWSNALRPALDIDLSMDSRHQLDRRLGIALGVLLFVNRSFGSS